WCLLAFVVSVTQARLEGAFGVLLLSLLYIGVMLFVIRPLAQRLARRYGDEDIKRGVVAGVLLALLASALATEAIGIHAVFGAFLLGAMIPHDCAITRVLTRQLQDLVTVLLLPAYFAFTGMRTHIGLVSGWEDWLICGMIILAATV